MDRRPANLEDLDCLVLTGFMGSGKTTVGGLLAQRLGWRFADLDAFISRRERLSVPEIFATHGEAVFRSLEVNALRELLAQPKLVISLGGGAPETPSLRDLLSSALRTAVIHLHAPFEILYERCVADAGDPRSVARPLLRERAEAAERYERRMEIYAAVAQHRAEVAWRTPPEIVEDILSTLRAEVTRR